MEINLNLGEKRPFICKGFISIDHFLYQENEIKTKLVCPKGFSSLVIRQVLIKALNANDRTSA